MTAETTNQSETQTMTPVQSHYLSQLNQGVERGIEIAKSQGKHAAIIETLEHLRDRPLSWWEEMATKSGILNQGTYPGGRYPSLVDALTHGCAVTATKAVQSVASYCYRTINR